MSTRPSRMIATGSCLALALWVQPLGAAERPSWTTPVPPPAATAPAKPSPAATQPGGPTTTAAPVTAPTDPRGFLTIDQLWQTFGEKQYNLVVREIVRISTNPKVAAGYNKFDLLTLRGESQLRLRNIPAAMEIFKEAQANAIEDTAKARATARWLLMQRQSALVFKARTGEPQNPKPGEVVKLPPPIDVLDLDKRTDAYKALYHDELTVAQPELNKIPKLTTLAAISATARTVDALWLLELAATGKHDDMDKNQVALVQQAKDILTSHLKENADKVADLKRTANTTHQVPLPRYNLKGQFMGNDVSIVKIGLTPQDTTALKDIINSLGKYAQAVKELTTRLHQEDKVFQPLATEADKVSRDATAVLKADYSNDIVPNNPGVIRGGSTNIPPPLPIKLK